MCDNREVPVAEFSALMVKVISRRFGSNGVHLYANESSKILSDFIGGTIEQHVTNDISPNVLNWVATTREGASIKYISNKGCMSINIATAEITNSFLRLLSGPLASMCTLAKQARSARIYLSKKLVRRFKSVNREATREYVASARHLRDRMKTNNADNISCVTVFRVRPGRYEVYDSHDQLWFQADIKPANQNESTVEIEIIDVKLGKDASFKGYLMKENM